MTLVRASGPIRVYLFLICLAAVSGLFLRAQPVRAGGPDDDPSIDFTTLSLEELKGVEITSASRTPERLSEIPAAVFVITSEDIRRSGATSIPDVLRMAPGVQVARISATEWAVNVRGLNEQYSNNLLVLVDGRSAYTHVLSGVFWDTVDTVLEDIERIEIIRGPGAALWGVNAVNGVINIITKNARKTQGHEVTALVGTQESISTARYGGIFGKGGYYRIYAKGFYRGSLFENDRNIFDDPSRSNWRSGRGGFRMDMNPNSGEDALTVEGEAYAGQVDVRTGTPSLYEPWFSEEDETDRSSGGHILSRWQHRFSDTSDTVWRLYYDYYNRDFDGGSVCVNTLDLDFQHSFALAEIHELTWGLNGRLVSDSFQDNFSVSAWPSGDDQLFYSAFFQDKVPLLPKHLWLTLGAKFERSSEAGTEIQPSMRLLWTPVQGHSLWAAVSRAARVPSRIEKDGVKNEFVYAPGTYSEDVPTVVRKRGSDSLVPEQLIAYELGYGFQPAENMWLNIAGFYNNYEHLIGLHLNRSVTTGDDPVPHDLVLFEYDNNSSGQSFGMEISAYWQPARFWRLQGAYTFLETRLRQEVSGADPDMENILSQASNPRNQISIRSSLDLTEQLEFDAWLRYVDRLSENRVDDYLSMDLRLAWNVTPLLELSVTGQDLLESRHAEFSSLEIRRSVYVKMDWSF